MKSYRIVRCAVTLALALTAAAVLPAQSWARHGVHFKVEANSTRQGDVTVPKGETLRDNLTATGDILVDGVVDGDCVSLGGKVVINGEVRGDAAALGGPAEVAGTVNGDMAVMGGSLHISGTVRGDVAALGGDVTLDPKAELGGDLSLLGGKLHKADGAIVRGTLSNRDLGLTKTFIGLMPALSSIRHSPHIAEMLSPWERLVEFIIFVVFAAGMGLIIVLLSVFFPNQVSATASMIKMDFWKTAGVGALVVMLTFPGLLLMVITIIGIPLVPVAILAYCAAVFMGLAACSQLLAARFYEVRQQPMPTALAAVAQGYGLLVCLFFIGKLLKLTGGIGSLLGGIFIFANLVLLSGGLVVGLGAAWLTRMGTKAKISPATATSAIPAQQV